MTTPVDPVPPQTGAKPTPPRSGLPLPSIPIPNLHNVASLLETVAFIVAAILYTLNHGADQSNAVNTALFGAIFHAYNH